MCSVCLKSPCDSRCPNAPEPEAVEDCYVCDDPIIVGDEFIEIGEVSVCGDCIENMTIRKLSDITGLSCIEILLELGGELKIAEAD